MMEILIKSNTTSVFNNVDLDLDYCPNDTRSGNDTCSDSN
jgi:hypothetical protein